MSVSPPGFKLHILALRLHGGAGLGEISFGQDGGRREFCAPVRSIPRISYYTKMQENASTNFIRLIINFL